MKGMPNTAARRARKAPRLGAAAILLALACCATPFPRLGYSEILDVRILQGERGEPNRRVPLSLTTPSRFRLRVEARKADGSRDVGFSQLVRVSSKPGSVVALRGEEVIGRNVALREGVAEFEVDVVGAYGDTRIWVEDVGYDPAPDGEEPRCKNGADDDGDGRIDYPLDPGCALANDDSEQSGTFATGASPPVYFAYPRIADLRGVDRGGRSTPFAREQVRLDTGYRDDGRFEFSTVVTRISSDGFYVTDINDPRGYSSVFAFTQSTPPRLRICDRVRVLSGTVAEFFGSTQLSFPTWSVERFDPASSDPRRARCRIPAPHVLADGELIDKNGLYRWIAGLVRVETADGRTVRVTRKAGPRSPVGPDFLPSDDATNCDLNGDGRITFAGGDEERCARACEQDVECSEWSAFADRRNFQLVVETESGAAKIQANTSAVSGFDPLASRGQTLRAVTGTLRFFSGGQQFTIEPRCGDDLVVALDAAPLSSDVACVRRRTEVDPNEASQ